MAELLVTGTLATTDPIEKYGGKALSEREIAEMARQVKLRGLPLSIDHDSRRQVKPTVRKVWLSRSDRGTLELKAEFVIDEEAWHALGGRLAFSYESWEEMVVHAAVSDRLVGIYAEASEFDDETIHSAIQQLQHGLGDDVPVTGGRIYQFSEFAPAKVLIEFLYTTLQALPPGIVCAAVYDVLKAWFLRPKHASETDVKLRVIAGTHETTMHITTSDPQVLKAAIDGFRDVALKYPQCDHIEFDVERSRWVMIGGKGTGSRPPNPVQMQVPWQQPRYPRAGAPTARSQRRPSRKRPRKGGARSRRKAK